MQEVLVDYGTTYQIEFWYKSTVTSGVVAFICYDQSWSKLIASSNARIQSTGDNWTLGSFEITVPNDFSIEHTELIVTLGDMPGTIIIDDVSMKVSG